MNDHLSVRMLRRGLGRKSRGRLWGLGATAALAVAGVGLAACEPSTPTGPTPPAPIYTIAEIATEFRPSMVSCTPNICHYIKSSVTGAGGGNHTVMLHAIINGTDRVIWVGTVGASLGKDGLAGGTWSNDNAYYQAAPGTEVYGVLDGYLTSNHIIWS